MIQNPLAILLLSLILAPQLSAQGQMPAFRMEEIETKLGVGYAVLIVDVNHDGKNDIVIVDTTRVVWYENPSWKRRSIIEGGTKPDNVCIAAHDIDGDGLVDFALGADWKPANTSSGGTLQWLKRGKTLDELWSIHPIDTEPTIHRIRFADIDGSGKPALVVVPLHGRGATAKNNWMDGQPVRILAYRIPMNPVSERWPMEVLDQSLHVVHNFWPLKNVERYGFLCASYEGVSSLALFGKRWKMERFGTGNQDTPKGKRGASEIKMGSLRGAWYVATIEPWHGDEVVVYIAPKDGKDGLWPRQVIDNKLRWGHAVSCADLDGDGKHELIVGVRDNPGAKDKHIDRRGVRVYKAMNNDGTQWSRTIVDNGGVAVEDLAVGDLDGDGRPDIVAVGRQTKNARVYWNLGSNK